MLIVGAGLIGLKCAEGLAGRVASITVCDLADRVLSSVLDAECAAVMQKWLEENGISFMLGDTAERFEENEAVMKSGKTVPFDILVLAVGVRANTALVKDIGGEVNRGIVVNDRMETRSGRHFRRRRLHRRKRHLLRHKACARDSSQRIYAGAYRRSQHGGRQRGL